MADKVLRELQIGHVTECGVDWPVLCQVVECDRPYKGCRFILVRRLVNGVAESHQLFKGREQALTVLEQFEPQAKAYAARSTLGTTPPPDLSGEGCLL